MFKADVNVELLTNLANYTQNLYVFLIFWVQIEKYLFYPYNGVIFFKDQVSFANTGNVQVKYRVEQKSVGWLWNMCHNFA